MIGAAEHRRLNAAKRMIWTERILEKAIKRLFASLKGKTYEEKKECWIVKIYRESKLQKSGRR